MHLPRLPLPARTLHRRLLCAALGVGAASLVTVGVLAATGPSEGPRPVTTEEAEQLAFSRFGLFEQSPLEVEAEVPMGDSSLRVRALVDYRAHRAVGSYTAGGAKGLLAWDATGLAVAKGEAGPATAAVAAAGKLPSRAWSPRAYSTDPLDAALRIAMALGSDRPDNPQLLAQQGAMRLGEEQLDGATYRLYSGPRPAANSARRGASAAPSGAGRPAPAVRPPARSPLTYWIGEDRNLRRVVIQPAQGGAPSRIEFGRTAKAKVPEGPWQKATAARP